MRRALLVAAAVSFLPMLASASEIPPSIFLINLVPASVGFDTQLRLPIGWPVQIPLSLTHVIDAPQRLVITPRLVVWTERPHVSFDVRAGWRGVFRAIWRGKNDWKMEPYIGLGSTLEFQPIVRPTLSPEAGVRIGKMGTGTLGALTVSLQGDFGVNTRGYFETPAARGTLAVGWVIY